MPGNMKGNTYCTFPGKSHRDFDIDFLSFELPAKHPHFSSAVQFFLQRAFAVVDGIQLPEYVFPIPRSNFKLGKCNRIFASIIPENYAPDGHFMLEVLQVLFYFLFNHAQALLFGDAGILMLISNIHIIV